MRPICHGCNPDELLVICDQPLLAIVDSTEVVDVVGFSLEKETKIKTFLKQK